MKWIDVNEFVPEPKKIVLCCDELNNFITFGRYCPITDEFEIMFIDDMEIDSCVTHWMPLPELPGVNE